MFYIIYDPRLIPECNEYVFTYNAIFGLVHCFQRTLFVSGAITFLSSDVAQSNRHNNISLCWNANGSHRAPAFMMRRSNGDQTGARTLAPKYLPPRTWGEEQQQQQQQQLNYMRGAAAQFANMTYTCARMLSHVTA